MDRSQHIEWEGWLSNKFWPFCLFWHNPFFFCGGRGCCNWSIL